MHNQPVWGCGGGLPALLGMIRVECKCVVGYTEDFCLLNLKKNTHDVCLI